MVQANPANPTSNLDGQPGGNGMRAEATPDQNLDVLLY